MTTDTKPAIIRNSKPLGEHFGKGSVGYIGEQVAAVLTPVRYNGVPNCLHLKMVDSQVDTEDYRYGSARGPAFLIDTFEDNGFPSDTPVTMPGLAQSPKQMWNGAAEFFTAMAELCHAEAKKAKDD